MMDESDRTTLGASERGREVMKWLKESGVFPSEMDAYKLAIAVGINLKKRVPVVGRQTSFNVGSFDSDGLVAALIGVLVTGEAGQSYRIAEEFAEAGVQEIGKSMDLGEFRFSDLLQSRDAPAGL
jgi:hypothetical protein